MNKVFTTILSDFNQKLERVSWFTDVSTEELELIKELISDMKRTHNNLLRTYYNFCREKGIAKEELKAFKIAIDDYKENIDDIESIYFRLPHRADFMTLNEDLASV